MFKNLFNGSFEIFRTSSNTGIVINGNHYQGSSLTISNDNVYIDGKQVFSANVDLNITIESKDNMEVDVSYCKKLDVNGPVKKVSTASGDVHVVGDVSGSVSTASGDVRIDGNVGGGVSTASGDVEAGGSITGKVSTISGDISSK